MTLPDLRKTEPELLQDDIEAVLQDSMDVDWTCATGALAVMALLHKLAASGMETRQGQDRETGLGAEHDSPTRQGDAQPQPLGNPLDTGDGK